MMTDFKNKTAVLTGAGSGFGLECARIGAKLGMNLVLADVQQDALDKAVAEVTALGAQVLPFQLDVSKAEQVEAMGAATLARFGAPHLVFNNAGIGAGGLITMIPIFSIFILNIQELIPFAIVILVGTFFGALSSIYIVGDYAMKTLQPKKEVAPKIDYSDGMTEKEVIDKI